MTPSPAPDLLRPTVAGDVAERLRAVEQTLQASLSPRGFVALELLAALRYAVFPGGQRWRPLLTLAAAELAGASWRDALPAAAAAELIHSCSLVFDDLPCMDDAAERRGLLPVHVRFGEGTATLAGLGLLTTAYGLLARTPRPGRAVALASRLIGPTDLLTGQAVDLQLLGRAQAGGDTAGYAPELLRRVQNRKTSALVKLALHLGALHGQVDASGRRALSAFGSRVGNAYQFMDDLHDLRADADLRAASGGSPEPEGADALHEAMERELRGAAAALRRAFPETPAREALVSFTQVIRARAAAADPVPAQAVAR